tara:strand:+ start:35547 stop:36161 length:615 start_codon:yes stop_codon:yes gene_type:complete
MVIRSGSEWGTQYDGGCPTRVAETDREIGKFVEDCWNIEVDVPLIGVIGGDIWRAAGSPQGGVSRLDGNTARKATIDLGELWLDDQRHVVVAHTVFLKSWWRGPVTAIMNSEWRRTWRVAPRAHPNDGWFDLVAGDLTVHQRWLAWQRLKSGDHLPNSHLESRRIKELTRKFPTGTRALVDGVSVGECEQVTLRVVSDAISIVY